MLSKRGEEDDKDGTYLDANLLKGGLDCLKAMKGSINCEFGPENVICEEHLGTLEGTSDTRMGCSVLARSLLPRTASPNH